MTNNRYFSELYTSNVHLTNGGRFHYEHASVITYLEHMWICDFFRDLAGLDNRTEDWQAECIDCGADIPEDTDNGMCDACLTDHIIRMAQINWVADNE